VGSDTALLPNARLRLWSAIRDGFDCGCVEVKMIVFKIPYNWDWEDLVEKLILYASVLLLAPLVLVLAFLVIWIPFFFFTHLGEFFK
jgi:hypothetical protein